MLWYRQAVIVTCQFAPACNLWLLSDVRIPFPLDSVRTNGWNFTQFYIGKILDGILPVGFHKFVTELWALIDIFTTWNALYQAIVRFSELDIVLADLVQNFMCIVNSECINYRFLKTKFKIEPYITALQPRWYITLSRFRTTSNRLPIEFEKPPWCSG